MRRNYSRPLVAFAAVALAAGMLLRYCGGGWPARDPYRDAAAARTAESVAPRPTFGLSVAPTAPSPAAAKAGPADPREAFARANSLYEAGKYREAADGYEALVGDGYRGGNLYYNLGNACLKLDQKGKAILYYRKALLLLPRDQDVKTNLEYATSLVEDRLAPRPKPWIARRWDTVVGWFTLREWRLAAAAFFWALCAAVVGLVYAPAARRALARVALTSAALVIVSASAALSRAWLEGQEQAVVLSREAKVRYGPSEKDVVAFVLHEGATVELENEKGDWLQVSLPDGKAGWVERARCGLI